MRVRYSSRGPDIAARAAQILPGIWCCTKTGANHVDSQ